MRVGAGDPAVQRQALEAGDLVTLRHRLGHPRDDDAPSRAPGRVDLVDLEPRPGGAEKGDQLRPPLQRNTTDCERSSNTKLTGRITATGRR